MITRLRRFLIDKLLKMEISHRTKFELPGKYCCQLCEEAVHCCEVQKYKDYLCMKCRVVLWLVTREKYS